MSRKYDAGRVRVPAAERDRQPAAAVRGVHRAGAPDRVHVGHARAVRAAASRTAIVEQIVRPTGLIDPEVQVRPTKGQVDDLIEEIRRRAEAGPAGARHHPHEEDGRGPHRLPGRDGDPRALPALRGRHDPAHRDRARPAAGGVRRAGRHQPAARGARPARGVARRDPRRRQGGVPALRDLAHPDDRPRGAQRRRHRDHVRRRGHRLDEGGDRRDAAAAPDPAGVQRGARHRPADRSAARSPTSCSRCAATTRARPCPGRSAAASASTRRCPPRSSSA